MIKSLQRIMLRGLRRKGYQLSRIPRWTHPVHLVDEAEHLRVLRIIREVVAERDDADTAWTGEAYARRERAAFYYQILDHWLRSSGAFPEGGKLLDVGAFHGYFLRIVSKREPSAALFGTEIHEACVPIAARVCPEATMLPGNADAARPHGPYDRICLTEVLEHLEDPELMARQLVGMLRPGGSAVFTVPNGRYDSMPAGRHYPEHTSYSGHINFWSIESWRGFWHRTFPDLTLNCEQLDSGHLCAVVNRPL